MPRYLRTFDEIKKGVTLQFEGYNLPKIAKILTAEYIQKLFDDGHITKSLNDTFIKISEERHNNESTTNLLKKMKTHLPTGTKLEDSMLRGTIVQVKRLRDLAKTEQWKEFQSTFEKERTKLEAEKAAKESFEREQAK